MLSARRKYRAGAAIAPAKTSLVPAWRLSDLPIHPALFLGLSFYFVVRSHVAAQCVKEIFRPVEICRSFFFVPSGGLLT